MNKKKLAAEIYKHLSAQYPEARPMLTFGSPFEALTAVILSAQSTDAQVNRVTAELFKVVKRPEDLMDMDIADLENIIRGVGIYANKARSLKAMAQMLHDHYTSQVPDDFGELLKLPGVGRKTANVVMSVAFNKPGLGVDTHVQRVANRIGLVKTKKTEATEKELKKIFPRRDWSLTHHLLIFHGRKVCKARKPDCLNCVIEKCCAKAIE
jgi:endonuclease-3